MASKPLVVALSVLAASSACGQSSAVQYAQDKIIKKIRVFGERRIAYHLRDVSGDRSAYDITNDGGFGDRKITDLGYLRVEGRGVMGWLNFDANIQDSRFIDPQADRYRLWYDDKVWTAEYGDIRATLPTRNRFVTLNNSTTGMSLGYKNGPLRVGAIRTESRSEPRSVSIQGTNSAGPYYLQSSQIVRGSERIEVDGVPQVLGRDYTIDYDLGAILFLNRQTLESRIISPTSTIVASYESFNFAGAAGRIEGVGLVYDMGRFGQIGVTGARQVTGSNGSLSTRLEKFQGFGPPSTPYFLQFQPLLSQPIVVRVDGVLQTQNLDWYLDPDNRSIFYFTRFMPSSSNIDVLYTPTPTGQVQGDREVTGFDYTLPFNGGQLTYNQATGRSVNSPTTTSGTARSATAKYSTGPWTLSGGFRDIPSGYVTVQSASLNRNEKANDWRIGIKAGQNGRFDFGNVNSSILSLGGTSNSFVTTRSTRSYAEYALTNDPKVALPVTLNFSRNQTRNPSVNNTIDTYGLTTSRIWGALTAGLTVDQQRVTGTQTADVNNIRLQTSYAAGKVWDFSLGAGLSRIRSGGQSGNGHDYLGAVGFRPTDSFSARLAFADHDSGSVSSIGGIDTGYGTGYGGNGFTSGTGTSFGNGGSSGQNTSLTLRWQPSDRLGLRASGLLFRSAGSATSNSRTESASLGMDYDLGGGHYLGGDLDFSTTTFAGGLQKSATTNASGFVNGRFGKLGYRASGSILLSGGTSQFGQDSVAFDMFLDYKLAARHSLGFTANYGNVTGYLPQSQLDFSLTYQYQIWEALALNVRYRFSDNMNSDPFLSSGAYRARTLDFELAFNFGR